MQPVNADVSFYSYIFFTTHTNSYHFLFCTGAGGGAGGAMQESSYVFEELPTRPGPLSRKRSSRDMEESQVGFAVDAPSSKRR